MYGAIYFLNLMIMGWWLLLINTFWKVKCGVKGDTGPACNAVGMIDRKILGIQHLYRKPAYARTKVSFFFHLKNHYFTFKLEWSDIKYFIKLKLYLLG